MCQNEDHFPVIDHPLRRLPDVEVLVCGRNVPGASVAREPNIREMTCDHTP